MAEASRDGNFVPTLLAVSNVDGVTPVKVYADPVTHRLLTSPSGAGSGDVVGPASATDSAIALFDTTTGKLLKNSVVTISATGEITVNSEFTLPNTDGTANQVLMTNGSGVVTWGTPAGSGTVTSVSVVSANGLAGSVATATSTPAITLSTTITGILQGDGTAISAASTTGSGSVVLATSPTLVTPALGTPASGVLTNCTGYAMASLAGLGTGVATALAINVGSAGAFVTLNGALGTPSSGTVTNLTGTASININGTVGATTPTTATFTTATINTNLVPDANDGAGLGISGTAFSDLFLADSGVINWAAGDITLTHDSGNGLILGNTFAGSGGPIFTIYQNSASPAVNDIVGTVLFRGEDSASNTQTYSTITSVIADATSTSEDGILKMAVVTAGTLANELELTGAALYPTTNDGLALGNATNQYSDLFLAEGAVINWDNGDATLTQVSNDVTLAGASLTARVKPRTGTTTSSATPTINTDDVDSYSITAQTVDITSFTTNLSGTPTEAQKLHICVTGTAARAITWGASFENGPVALPTTTVTTTRLDVFFIWNSVTSKWRCMASGSTV